MGQITFRFLSGNGSVVTADQLQGINRASLDIFRVTAQQLFGRLRCPKDTENCGVTIAVGANKSMKFHNPCHKEFVDRITSENNKLPTKEQFAILEMGHPQ